MKQVVALHGIPVSLPVDIDVIEVNDSETAKGGPGSGYFNHAGRPGKRGGSAPFGKPEIKLSSDNNAGFELVIANNLDGIPQSESESWMGYWIGKDDSLYSESSKLVGDKLTGGFHTLSMAKIIANNKDAPGHLRRKAFKVIVDKNIEDKDIEQYGLDNGYIKIRSRPSSEDVRLAYGATITVNAANQKTLKRIQKLIDMELIPYSSTYNIEISPGHDFFYRHVSDYELMSASSMLIDENALGKISLKSERSVSTKGGPGSGYFGHAGRPGKRGGSAAAGGSSSSVDIVEDTRIIHIDDDMSVKIGVPESLALDERGAWSGFYNNETGEMIVGWESRCGRPYHSDIVKSARINHKLEEVFGVDNNKHCTEDTLINQENFIVIGKIDETIYHASLPFDTVQSSFRKMRDILALNDPPQKAKVDITVKLRNNVYISKSLKMVDVLAANKLLFPRTVDTNGRDIYEIELKEFSMKGGPGSGYFGHAGRPGKRGGSAPSKSSSGITQTDSFKKWFGNGKIVNSDGSPRVVYHGTTSEQFDSFDTSIDKGKYDKFIAYDAALGAHFASSPSVASRFGLGVHSNPKYENGVMDYTTPFQKGRVIPVYLNLQNPKVISQETKNGMVMGDQYAIRDDIFRTVFPENKNMFIKMFVESVKENGVNPNGFDLKKEGARIYDLLSDGKDVSGTPGKYYDHTMEGYKDNPRIDPFGITSFAVNYFSNTYGRGKTRANLVNAYKKILKKQGYDGVQYINTAPMEVQETKIRIPSSWEVDRPWWAHEETIDFPDEPDRVTYVAFEPTQIKSAIGNTGDFDPTNPSIMKEYHDARRYFLSRMKARAYIVSAIKGGAGSGNFGHSGRPGKVGGSAPNGKPGGVLRLSREMTEFDGQNVTRITVPNSIPPKTPKNTSSKDVMGYSNIEFDTFEDMAGNKPMDSRKFYSGFGGFWIKPDGTLITDNNMQTHTQIIAREVLNGNLKASAEEKSRALELLYENNHEDEPIEDVGYRNGWMKVGDRRSGRGLMDVISGYPIGVGLVKRIQRLVDQGKLPYPEKEDKVFKSLDYDIMVGEKNKVPVKWNALELIASSGVVNLGGGNFVLKERGVIGVVIKKLGERINPSRKKEVRKKQKPETKDVKVFTFSNNVASFATSSTDKFSNDIMSLVKGKLGDNWGETEIIVCKENNDFLQAASELETRGIVGMPIVDKSVAEQIEKTKKELSENGELRMVYNGTSGTIVVKLDD